MKMSFINEPVLNIIVVGFHHKKGCQVEHCYPEFLPGHPTELPPAWRHLPALALPDGSHNYLSDTIFFNLPGLTEPAHTVYGVSCFRQIPTEQVAQKTEDMTRSSIQKSVCVVCSEPLFGRLAVKMELVAQAWFLQGDFSETKLLEDAYRHLNSCPMQMDQTLEGLSVTQLVENWKHEALLLFKLLLLRRKVLIYGSPAGNLSSALLSLVSLLPQCLEQGLSRSANVVLTRPLSPSLACNNKDENGVEDASETFDLSESGVSELSTKETGNILEEKDKISQKSFDESASTDIEDTLDITIGRNKYINLNEKTKLQLSEAEGQQSPTLARDALSIDGLFSLAAQIDQAECGFPLPLFEDGNICLPYSSLQYLDVLSDPAVQGFIVGASNVLFKQKRQLFDVLVELNEMKIETGDLGLRKQLTRGIEDLRFVDYVVRQAPNLGDSGIRDQFAIYLIYLLRTSLLPEGSREIEPYNAQFMTAFKSTPAYQKWLKDMNKKDMESFLNLTPGHPFAGQLSVADMKLKLALTMSTTEGGRKVSAAVAGTGRAVATTSRAVGGALSHARGALSGWWSAVTAPPPAAPAPPPAALAPLPAAPAPPPAALPLPAAPDEPPDKGLDDTTHHLNKIQVI